MNNIGAILNNRLEQLTLIEAQATKHLAANKTKGHIYSSKSNGVYQYYYFESGNSNKGKYIRNENRDLAIDIAMRDYNEKIIKCVQQWKVWIERTLNTMPTNTIVDIYNNSKGRKQLITPYEITNEEYARNWQAQQFIPKEFSDEMPEIYSERGERVRSKSEKLIADKLYMLKIPYRYEQPLQLNGYGVVYPDFTILNRYTRNEIIYEHFGMMDNPEYASNAIKKINTYSRNGYILGTNFIATFETSSNPFDVRMLERILHSVIEIGAEI